MSGDKEKSQREREDVSPSKSARQSNTLSSRIPAAIRAYSTLDEHQIVPSTPDTSGRLPQRTATTGLSALGAPLQQANATSVQETLLGYLQQMESVEQPTRFSSDSVSFIAASGRISPEVAGDEPVDTIDAPAERRVFALGQIWNRLSELAQRGVELQQTSLASGDASGVVSEEWLHPVEFSFRQTAVMHPTRLPLVEELREQIGATRAIMLLFRRDRDEHPLLRTHNLTGGEQLTLSELDQLIRYGETMSRELAVLSGSSVPGANRWFGLQIDHAAMIVSFRDLTLIGLFGLDRLGLFVSLAESLETVIRASE